MFCGRAAPSPESRLFDIPIYADSSPFGNMSPTHQHAGVFRVLVLTRFSRTCHKVRCVGEQSQQLFDPGSHMAPRRLPKYGPYGPQWPPPPPPSFTFLSVFRAAVELFEAFSENKLPVCMKNSNLHVRQTQDASIHHVQSACSDLSAEKCNLTHQFSQEPPAMSSIQRSRLCSGSQLNLGKLGFVGR